MTEQSKTLSEDPNKGANRESPHASTATNQESAE
jgi:hypothetical protein